MTWFFDMDIVPLDAGPVVLATEARHVVLAVWECLEGGDEAGNGWIFAWMAAHEGEHPPSWEDGTCWDDSDQPIAWALPPEPLPAPPAAEDGG